jgi:hypothetical protein
MKKIYIILAVMAKLFTSSFAQVVSQSDSVKNDLVRPDPVKNQYRCFVIIKTIKDEDIHAALARFSPDSIFLASVEEEYVKAGSGFIKILKEEVETGIAVAEISSFKIKYDDNIIYRDDLKKRKKVLRRKNAGRIVGMVFSGIVTAPAALVGGGPVIIDSKEFSGIGKRKTSVSGSTLHVPKTYKIFQLDGDNEKYIEMIKQLTKSKTNPFEESIEK